MSAWGQCSGELLARKAVLLTFTGHGQGRHLRLKSRSPALKGSEPGALGTASKRDVLSQELGCRRNAHGIKSISSLQVWTFGG